MEREQVSSHCWTAAVLRPLLSLSAASSRPMRHMVSASSSPPEGIYGSRVRATLSHSAACPPPSFSLLHPHPSPFPALMCPELVVAVVAAALRRFGLCVFLSKQGDNWNVADEFPHPPDILQPIGACESFAPRFASNQQLHLQLQATS